MESLSKENLIAACGMNCGICMVYLREKNNCPGCRASDDEKPITRTACKIKTCQKRDSEYCYTCTGFPCKRIKHLDNRYRKKYNMSMIENLLTIKESGIKKLLDMERNKWACPSCGGTLIVHKGICSSCGV